VAKKFLDAPFVGGIAEIAVGLGAAAEQEKHLAALIF